MDQLRHDAIEEYTVFVHGEGTQLKLVFPAFQATEVSDFMIRLALVPITIGLSFSVVKGVAA